tara:strand:- start:258 stop:428 length:171 start_codon:yes stop_codon:yes gene_type:complete
MIEHNIKTSTQFNKQLAILGSIVDNERLKKKDPNKQKKVDTENIFVKQKNKTKKKN